MEQKFEDVMQQSFYESLAKASTISEVHVAFGCAEVMLFQTQINDVLDAVPSPSMGAEVLAKYLAVKELIQTCVDGLVEETMEAFASRLIQVEEVSRLYRNGDIMLKNHEWQLIRGMRLYCLGKLNQLK